MQNNALFFCSIMSSAEEKNSIAVSGGYIYIDIDAVYSLILY